MTLPPIGQKQAKLPRNVTLVRELEEFEGPILTEYKAQFGSACYVEKWCARGAGVSRFLLVRSDHRAIAEFLGGRLTMLKLLLEASDGSGYLIDRERGKTVGVRLVSLDELPKGYLPKATVFHDESLRPHWDMIPESYLLDSWDAKLLATIERTYSSAAGFSYLTMRGSNSKLPAKVLDLHFDGGYPIMHAFNSIRANVPKEESTRTATVAAASPGVITMDVPAETATHLRKALYALRETRSAYDAVHAWSRLKPDNASDVPSTAHATLERLCNALGVDPEKITPKSKGTEERTLALLVAGKLIAAYYRMLRRVVFPAEGAEYASIPRDEQALIKQEPVPVPDAGEDIDA